MEASTCPACQAAVELTAAEAFCPRCGHKLRESSDDVEARIARQQADFQLGRARRWLAIVAVITWVSGAIFYVTGSSQLDKDIANLEDQTRGIDPAQRDALMKAETGMTFQEAIDHDRRQIQLLLGVNIGLGLVYLAMWWWARKNPLAATVAALLLFVTVIAINAILDAKTMAQGILVKILVISALASAVAAAMKSRAAQRT